MMRALILLAVLVLLAAVLGPVLRVLRGLRAVGPPRRDELVKDPICQTYVVASRAVTREADGVVMHFCSQECATRYVSGEGRA